MSRKKQLECLTPKKSKNSLKKRAKIKFSDMSKRNLSAASSYY